MRRTSITDSPTQKWRNGNDAPPHYPIAPSAAPRLEGLWHYLRTARIGTLGDTAQRTMPMSDWSPDMCCAGPMRTLAGWLLPEHCNSALLGVGEREHDGARDRPYVACMEGTPLFGHTSAVRGVAGSSGPAGRTPSSYSGWRLTTALAAGCAGVCGPPNTFSHQSM